MATRNRTEFSWLSTLLATGVYKRNQGRLARQLTVLAIWILVFIGCYQLSNVALADFDSPVRLGIPIALAVFGAWCAYRLVNYPPFADFLVSVEAEMAKVSWPTRDEVYRATIVVIVVMLLLAIGLGVFDIFWQWLFRMIGVIHTGGAGAGVDPPG